MYTYWSKFETQAILAFSLFAIFFLLSSLDFLSFYISLEFYSFTSILLILLKYNNIISNLSLIYFLINVIGSISILFSFLYIFSFFGILNYIDLIYIYDNKLGFILLLFGLLIKLGSAPFHFWVLTLYNSISTIITLFQSIIPKILYTIIIIEIIDYINKEIIIIFAILTLLTGSIIGLNQKKIKKLLAASSIFNLGLFLIAIISDAENIIFIILIYLINILNIFIILFIFNNINILNKFKSISLLFPTISILILISIFSIIGIPPFAGFWYKLFIFNNLILSNNLLLLLIAIIATFISSIYYLYFIQYIYSYKYKLIIYTNINNNYIYSILFSITSIFIISFYWILPYNINIFNLFNL